MYVILAMGPIRGGGEAVGEGGYEKSAGKGKQDLEGRLAANCVDMTTNAMFHALASLGSWACSALYSSFGSYVIHHRRDLRVDDPNGLRFGLVLMMGGSVFTRLKLMGPPLPVEDEVMSNKGRTSEVC